MTTTNTKTQARLVSLDVYRGITMFLLIEEAAHTIWGAICGKLLLSDREPQRKVRLLVIAGLTFLALGYSLDWAGIPPIIKRIATTSFIFASGGWCLLSLAFFYWLVDIKGYRGWTLFFTIVGMNPIFIYLFAETIGVQWLNDFVRIFNDGFLGMAGLNEPVLSLTNALFAWGILWYLCYFLYRKRIFFKI